MFAITSCFSIFSIGIRQQSFNENTFTGGHNDTAPVQQYNDPSFGDRTRLFAEESNRPTNGLEKCKFRNPFMGENPGSSLNRLGDSVNGGRNRPYMKGNDNFPSNISNGFQQSELSNSNMNDPRESMQGAPNRILMNGPEGQIRNGTDMNMPGERIQQGPREYPHFETNRPKCFSMNVQNDLTRSPQNGQGDSMQTLPAGLSQNEQIGTPMDESDRRIQNGRSQNEQNIFLQNELNGASQNIQGVPFQNGPSVSSPNVQGGPTPNKPNELSQNVQCDCCRNGFPCECLQNFPNLPVQNIPDDSPQSAPNGSFQSTSNQVPQNEPPKFPQNMDSGRFGNEMNESISENRPSEPNQKGNRGMNQSNSEACSHCGTIGCTQCNTENSPQLDNSESFRTNNKNSKRIESNMNEYKPEKTTLKNRLEKDNSRGDNKTKKFADNKK